MANTEQRELGCSADQDIFSHYLLNPKRQNEHAPQVLEWAVLCRRENFCLRCTAFLHSTFCCRLWFFGWSGSHVILFCFPCLRKENQCPNLPSILAKNPFKTGTEMRGLISSGVYTRAGSGSCAGTQNAEHWATPMCWAVSHCLTFGKEISWPHWLC